MLGDDGDGMRHRMIPLDTGSLAREASSPKSLSNMIRTRSSASARVRTCRSLLPGASLQMHATSCPRWRSATIASPEKFSLARIRIDYAATMG
jgi:hypothetical protein